MAYCAGCGRVTDCHTSSLRCRPISIYTRRREGEIVGRAVVFQFAAAGSWSVEEIAGLSTVETASMAGMNSKPLIAARIAFDLFLAVYFVYTSIHRFLGPSFRFTDLHLCWRGSPEPTYWGLFCR